MIIPTIHLQRATLREWSMADAVSITQHAANPKIAANLTDNFPSPYSIEDAHRWIGGEWRSAGYCWAIDVDGRACGNCSVRPDDGPYECSAEIGYWIGEACWGRGIMTEVIAALTDFAFQLPGIVRCYAPVFAHNAASMRVLEKNGYVREGILCSSLLKQGKAIDRVLYARIAN